MASAGGLTLLRGRAGAPDVDAVNDDRAGPLDQVDPHVWLDPANARLIVTLAAAELGRLDPANAARYADNGARVRARIEALDRALAATLFAEDGAAESAAVFAEDGVGAISVLSGRQPGARRLQRLRRLIVERGAGCVFAEPQFEPALVATLIEGTGAGSGVLDPLGADLAAGPDLYFILMRRLGESLKQCLAPAS